MTVKQARPVLRGVVAVLLVLAAAAVVVQLTPLGSRRGEREDEYARVRLQLKEEMDKAKPLQNIEQKLADAERDVAAFYKGRLPERDSAVPEELGKLANNAGVRFGGIKYAADDEPTQGLRRVAITAALAGDYLKVVKFINALERDKMFFIVDSVNLAEQQGGTVRLELKLETYLRSGT